MATLARRGGAEAHRTRTPGLAMAAALAALLLLCLAWLLHDERRSDYAAQPRLSLPTASRELPTLPNPEPLPLPAPRPLA